MRTRFIISIVLPGILVLGGLLLIMPVYGQSIGSGPPFLIPEHIAVEADGNLVLVDLGLKAVVRVDPITGDRTIVADATTGNGAALGDLQGMAVEASGTFVVTDDNLDAILRIDPTTGDRTVISSATTGSGPIFLAPRGIAVEASGVLVVVDILFGCNPTDRPYHRRPHGPFRCHHRQWDRLFISH